MPSYITRHWVPISSPPITRRTTVEVQEPTSMRLWTLFSRWFSLYNLGTGRIEETVPAVPLFRLRVRCQGDKFIDRYLTTAISSGSTIPVFQLTCYHVIPLISYHVSKAVRLYSF